MTLANLGFLLLGAVLVACGVLVASLADRVRGLRVSRNDAGGRAALRSSAAAPQLKTIDPSDTIFVPDENPAATRRGDRPARGTPRRGVPIAAPAAPAISDAGLAADVVAALMTAGISRRIATVTVQACRTEERGSLADWTRAALRRYAGGEVVS